MFTITLVSIAPFNMRRTMFVVSQGALPAATFARKTNHMVSHMVTHKKDERWPHRAAPATVQATIWSGEAGRQLPGALPWLRDCADASPQPGEMRSALEGLYRAGDAHEPRHHFLAATDHQAELCDNTVALIADAAQCLAPHAMILPV